MSITKLVFYCIPVCVLLLVPNSSLNAQSPLVREGDTWRFFRAVSAPPETWVDLEFNAEEAGWESGPGGIGYGDEDDATVLDDMADNYIAVYMRIEFDVPAELAEAWLQLRVRYDDSFVAYIDGEEVARRGIDGSPPLFDQGASVEHEITSADGFDEEFLLEQTELDIGRHVLAVEVHNINLGSSDLSFSAELVGSQLLVTSVDPAFGPLEGGNTVRVYALGIFPGLNPDVIFGNLESPSVTVEDDYIEAEVPAAKVPGAVDIIIDTVNATTVIPAGYIYANPDGGLGGLDFTGGPYATAEGFSGMLGEGTLQAWFRRGAGQGQFADFIYSPLASIEAADGSDAFILEVRPGNIRARTAADGDFNDLTATTDLPEGEWHNICCTFSERGRAVYLDGRQIAADNFSTNLSDCDRIRLGSRFEQGGGFFSGDLTGTIHSAAVWGFERFEEEIQQELFMSPSEDPYIGASWELNEGVGGRASDSGDLGADLIFGTGPGADVNDPDWVTIDDFPTFMVTGIQPASGPLTGGEMVRIFGAGFPLEGEVAVSFVDRLAPFLATPSPTVSVLSNWEITAEVPAAEDFQVVDVLVETPAGSGLLEAAYTYAPDPASIFTTIEEGDIWDYIIANEAMPESWNLPEFRPQENGWERGPTGIGYGDGDDATIVTGVQDQVPAVYARHEWLLSGGGENMSFLRFRIRYDDGFVAYLNGTEVARANLDGVPPAFDELATATHEITGGEGVFDEVIDLTDFRDSLRNGLNVLAIEVHNNTLGSSDMSLSAELEFSAPGETFIRGDVDNNQSWNVTDAVKILLHAFTGAELPCLEAADVDDSGRIDLEDGLGLLNFVFRQGEAPPPPLYEALPDLDSDELGCENAGE